MRKRDEREINSYYCEGSSSNNRTMDAPEEQRLIRNTRTTNKNIPRHVVQLDCHRQSGPGRGSRESVNGRTRRTFQNKVGN